MGMVVWLSSQTHARSIYDYKDEGHAQKLLCRMSGR